MEGEEPGPNIRFVSQHPQNPATGQEREDPELPLIFYYSDQEEGITIAVDGNRVMEYQIGPTPRDSNMRCNNPPG